MSASTERGSVYPAAGVPPAVGNLTLSHHRTASRDRGEMRAVLLAMQTLRDRVTENVRIADLAARAGLSPASFSRIFRKIAGEPPHRYRTRLRVELARSLIERGASAAEAALDAGFCDQSHLVRRMRQILGTSPSALSRTARHLMQGARAGSRRGRAQ